VALGAALALLLHQLASLVAPAPWRLLAPATFATLVYAPYTFGDHKWPALALGLLGLVVLARGAGRTAAAGAGLLLGSAMLFTQDLGLGLTAGALAFLLWRRQPLDASVLGLCAALPPLAALAFFAARAGLGTVVYDWVLFPLTRYRELNRFRLAATLSPRTLPRDLAQLALTAAGLAGAAAELRRGASSPPAALLIALAGLGTFAATAHRGFYPVVLAVQSAALVPLAVRLLARRLAGVRPLARPLESAALALISLGLVHGSIGFVLWRQLLQPMVFERHRAGAIWTAQPMPELAWIEAATRSGDPVFLLPARGGHYFLTHTRDVTAFPYVIEGQHTAEQARAALAQIEAARPAVGLWDQRPWPRSAPDAPGPLALLFEGLQKSYRFQRLPSGVFLLERRQP
jgi:hypothetical protein